jgi:FtsZ-binding cell division protein ZapB
MKNLDLKLAEEVAKQSSETISVLKHDVNEIKEKKITLLKQENLNLKKENHFYQQVLRLFLFLFSLLVISLVLNYM